MWQSLDHRTVWMVVALGCVPVFAFPQEGQPGAQPPGEIQESEQPSDPEPVSEAPAEALEESLGAPSPAPDPGSIDTPASEPEITDPNTFAILDKQVAPGELRQFNWQLETAMAGLAVPTPVLVAHGTEEGPTLCLVAAVHGDELNGVEIVRRIMFDLELDSLAGTVVGVPIANAFGFLRGSRYLPDRRDLNRYFPGATSGSMASRFAFALFNEVILRCNVLVDIHTGSFYRTNLPQLRADLTIGPVLHLTKQFGDIAVLHSVGPSGSLRRAATDVGIAAVTLETGGPARFQEGAVAAGVKAINALLNHLDMLERFRPFGQPQPVFYESTWVRAETGGILLSQVGLGDLVTKGQRLGTVTDPIENRREYLEAPFRGRILGMAVNQVVMPGFAAFHIGRAANEQEAIESSGGEFPDASDHPEGSDPESLDEEVFGPGREAADAPMAYPVLEGWRRPSGTKARSESRSDCIDPPLADCQ